jgi:hypothetical protein
MVPQTHPSDRYGTVIVSSEPLRYPPPLPRLDDLADQFAADPGKAIEALKALAVETRFALLTRAAGLSAALPAAAGQLEAGRGGRLQAPAANDWLPLEEAAPLLGVPPESLKRRWRKYPFARKASRKAQPVFSRHGLLAWLGSRRRA